MHGEYNKYIECMYRSLLTLRKYVGTLLEPARAGGLEEPEQQMRRPASGPGRLAGGRGRAYALLCTAGAAGPNEGLRAHRRARRFY